MTNPKPDRNGLPWTEEEDELVISWVGPWSEAAALLNRTYTSTAQRAHLLRKQGVDLARPPYRRD